MEVINPVMPVSNAGPVGIQAKVQQGPDALKDGKSKDIFTNVFNTVVNQKAANPEASDMQGNLTPINNLAALIAAVSIGEQNTGVANQDTAELPELNKENKAIDAQTLAAIMALIGNQTPGAVQNIVAGVPDGAPDITKIANVNVPKAKDSQIPFATLQGKVLSAIQEISLAQVPQNAAIEAKQPDTLPEFIVQDGKRSTQPQTTVNAVLGQAQDVAAGIATDADATKVQAVSQMLTGKSGQTANGQNDKPGKVDVALKSVNHKVSQDRVATLSIDQPQAEHTEVLENQVATLVQPITANTHESAGNPAGEFFQANTQSDPDMEVSTGGSQQPVVFSNVLSQHTDKAVSVHTIPAQISHNAQDQHNVAGQIVEHAKLFKHPFDANNSEMLIKLRPEHLGDLTLKVAVDNGVVSASFHSNNAEVRSIIEASLPQLKQELANQGLKVDNVDVYAGMSDFFSGSQQGELFRQQQQQQQQAAKLKNLNGPEDFVQAVEEKSAPQVMTADGVDYRV